MDHYIGIDLGTSALKALFVREDGKICAKASVPYDCSHPHEFWSEQEPSLWFSACKEAIKELVRVTGESHVKAIGIAGQMHGLVMLDENDKVLRPAILWNDGRSQEETDYLNNNIGKAKLTELTGNIAFAGFTAPKILWVKKHEPNVFAATKKIMLPKDYLNYMLSGKFVTDYSDASGFLLLDVKNRKYSKEMLDICGITEEMMPELHESSDVIGTLKEEFAKEFGIEPGCKLVAGAGDNAGSAIGTGTIGEGRCNISLGTSGTIFISSSHFCPDVKNALHSFCDAAGAYHLLGCTLSAASARKWWLEQIRETEDFAKDEIDVKGAKESNVFFMPYLAGERSPYNDVKVRAAFLGLDSTTTKADMSRAVMEGVAFSLKDCLDAAKEDGACPQMATISGGGFRSEEWCQIFADIFEIQLSKLDGNEGPSFGGAILGMVGDGKYESCAQAAAKIIKKAKVYFPNEAKFAYYRAKHAKYKSIYPLIKQIED